jgi:hypothetical protein
MRLWVARMGARVGDGGRVVLSRGLGASRAPDPAADNTPSGQFPPRDRDLFC